MLMLVSGRVARQGSYRMVISVELAYNKEADYLSPPPNPKPQVLIQALISAAPFEVSLDVSAVWLRWFQLFFHFAVFFDAASSV